MMHQNEDWRKEIQNWTRPRAKAIVEALRIAAAYPKEGDYWVIEQANKKLPLRILTHLQRIAKISAIVQRKTRKRGQTTYLILNNPEMLKVLEMKVQASSKRKPVKSKTHQSDDFDFLLDIQTQIRNCKSVLEILEVIQSLLRQRFQKEFYDFIAKIHPLITTLEQFPIDSDLTTAIKFMHRCINGDILQVLQIAVRELKEKFNEKSSFPPSIRIILENVGALTRILVDKSK